MTQPLNHEEAQALLATEALDALRGEERDALLEHVGDCAECSAELSSFRDTAAFLAEALPSVSMDSLRSAAIRTQLLARAAADGAARRAGGGMKTPDQRPAAVHSSPIEPLHGKPIRAIGRPPASRGGWYAAAAAVVLAAGLLTVLRSSRRDAGILRDEIAAVRAEQLDAYAKITLRDSLIEQLTGATVRIVGLTGDGSKPPVGWVLWDQNERWTLLTHDLPAVAANQIYQLWLITPGQRKLSAGTFGTDHRGHSVFRATLALPRDSLAAVAVTVEPAGGVAQPTGPVAMSGEAGK